jgi:uncharacterized protein YjiS (DUF1127 family)
MSDASLAAFAPPLPVCGQNPEPAAPGKHDRGGTPTTGSHLPLGLWLSRLKERRKLERMALDYPCYLLRDVGLRREDLLREASKPFWRS